MTTTKELIDRQFLPYVEKPLRYTGAELNAVRKDLSKVRLHGVFCFPDLYDLGMCHAGLQIIYNIVNRNPNWALSRCFTPWTDAEELMRKLCLPLYDLEYLKPLSEADWLGFTIQYELHCTNLLTMLDLAGIPQLQRDRTGREPFIIAGGPCMGNPEPIADFVDAFVIGDGEEAVVSVCKVLEQAKAAGEPRLMTLKRLAAIEGVYVPSLYGMKKAGPFLVPDLTTMPPVKSAKVEALQNDYYPAKPVIPIMEVVHHRLAVEVMRGCTRGCRFCAAGTYYRPRRERKPADLMNEIDTGISTTGWRDIGLLSLSTADYPHLGDLLRAALALKDRCRAAFSIPSTRIDALTPEQFDLLTSISPISALTLAPEAGSPRLRRVINKDFTDEAIYQAVKTLLAHQVQTIKLYFMIGLPTEQDEDIQAIIDMVTKIAGMARSASQRRKINVALSPFSPKAQTPFQWEAMEQPESLDRKNMMVKRALARFKNVKVSYRTISMSRVESVLARGDRTIGGVILEAWKNGGRFDGWDDQFDAGRWERAAQTAGVDLSAFTADIPETQELPWQAIDIGVSQEFLARERACSRTETPTPDCRTGMCAVCGVECGRVNSEQLTVNSGETGDRSQEAGEVNSEQLTVNRINGNTGEEASGSRLATHNSQLTTPSSRLATPTYGRRNAPAEQPQPERKFRYRFIYTKGDSIKYLGHIDMAGAFHRAANALGYPILYSQGFQPHPRMAFGPPLPFGVTGSAEAFDMFTTSLLTGDPLRMNAMLPPDLKVLSCAPVSEHADSLTVAIVAARYRIEPFFPVDAAELQGKVADLLALKSVEITITKNGESRTKDLRPLILDLQCSGNAVDALLKLEPGKTCKPAELADALFPGVPFTEFRVARTACLRRDELR